LDTLSLHDALPISTPIFKAIGVVRTSAYSSCAAEQTPPTPAIERSAWTAEPFRA
jgi:hypothetical protein